jgi:hypothetical protein
MAVDDWVDSAVIADNFSGDSKEIYISKKT